MGPEKPAAPGEGLQQRLARARELIAKRNAEGAPSAVPAATGSKVVNGWDDHPAIEAIQRQKQDLDRLGLPVPYGRPHESVSGNVITIDGREMINFSGYNYLGLSGHPEVSAGAKAAIDRYGTSASASRLAAGEITIHGELEAELAAMLGTESAIAFVSGYGTNLATISHLFGPEDLILHDALAHSSLLMGCLLSGARRLPFPHNDMGALERLLADNRGQHRRAVIVVEGVYSMDGDIAPVDRLVEIKRRHRALLMVDEAHSIGVLGARGFGIGEHFGLTGRNIDLWMGTLSKTLAACGGYIAGESAVIDCLRYSAPGFIYSVGLSPADTGAALAALRLMRREPDRVARLRRLSDQFRREAKAQGLAIGTSALSSVVPVIVGDSIAAMRLANALFKSGVNVHPIIYPAVEEKSARLRFFITSEHKGEQISRAVEATAVFLKKAGF
jgi:8-amino-7-oxononanoate synthase